MDYTGMLDKFAKVKELINGPEAENFKENNFGKFFTGEITLVFDKTPFVLTFYKGTLIDIVQGKSFAGVYVGLGGTWAQWAEFFEHRNFQLAISPKRNPNCFEFLGSPLAFRQNNSVIAELLRIIARVMAK